MNQDSRQSELAYLIAHNLKEKSPSTILKEFTSEQSEKLLEYVATKSYFDRNFEQLLGEFIDLKKIENDLVGKGFMVCLSQPTDDPDNPDEYISEITLPNGSKIFCEAVWLGEIYLPTEGIFAPGIYEFCEGDFFECKNAMDFVRTFLENPNIDFVAIKLSFSKEYVEVSETEDGQEIRYGFDRLSFTYFDVQCPVCKKTVWTYEPDADYHNKCHINELPCAHYITNLVEWNGRFINDHLEDLKCEYRFENDEQNLFLKNPSGIWKEAILQRGGEDEITSYWTRGDYFVFLNETGDDNTFKTASHNT